MFPMFALAMVGKNRLRARPRGSTDVKAEKVEGHGASLVQASCVGKNRYGTQGRNCWPALRLINAVSMEKAMLSRKLALLAWLAGAPLPVAAAIAQAPTQAPTRPTIPSLSAIDPAICADPIRRASLIAESERAADPSRAFVDTAIDYTESLVAWRGAQLVHSGRWTNAQREAFEAGLRNGQIRQSAEAIQTAVREALAAMAPPAPGTDQSVADCGTAIAGRAFEIRLHSLFEAQWRAIEAAYGAEARRLGVSIE